MWERACPAIDQAAVSRGKPAPTDCSLALCHKA